MIAAEWVGGPDDGLQLAHRSADEPLFVSYMRRQSFHQTDSADPAQNIVEGAVYPVLTSLGWRFFWNEIDWMDGD